MGYEVTFMNDAGQERNWRGPATRKVKRAKWTEFYGDDPAAFLFAVWTDQIVGVEKFVDEEVQ